MTGKKAETVVPVGEKIKQERFKKKMSLDRMARETGFTVDYLKKVESGKKMPPVGALFQIAQALEVDSGFFLKEQKSSLRNRIKAYNKRTENFAYTTLTPGAENKHLKAFKVVIEPMTDHKGVGYQHEGEEFIYVLAGKLEVIVGDHVNMLDAGESLHFNSGIRHKLRNIGDEKAELVVVIYGH